MKNLGHTKTLFVQGGKYKWSYKHDHCIECWLVKFKHKWRWLCTSCWDKKRAKNPRRREVLYKSGMKWHHANKPKIPREEWRKTWIQAFRTSESKKEYKRQWHINNYAIWKDAILCINRGKARNKKWLPCVQYKNVYLPFETLGKPFDVNMHCSMEEYDEWKEKMRLFDTVKAYLEK